MQTDQITYFEVNGDGLILYPNFAENNTRGDAYDLSRDCAGSPAALVSSAKYLPPLQWLIGEYYTEYREDPAHPDRLKSMPEDPEEGWIDWLKRINKKMFSSLQKGIKKWLSEEPNWGCEEDYIDYRKFNEGAVFGFFEDEPSDLLDALGIEIIDGPYPGNNSRGAELSRPIGEANAIAERMGLDYRFRAMNVTE